ncbi:MAG TPA: signal peptidase II [Ktedonobacterales bacterium]|nr:signal peptidase II [Ktedonobacterales bacterium]
MLTRGSVKPPASEETLSPEAQVRWDFIVAGIAVLVIALDQISKALVVAHFHTCTDTPLPTDVVPIIGNILSFQYLCNNGTAFSFFQNTAFVYFLIAVAVGVIAWLYWTSRPRRNPWLRLTFGMIIGGAAGNLIDRAVRHGQVVDFIHFQIPQLNFNFAVFNLADSAVVVGMLSLAAIYWLLPRENEPDQAELAVAKAPSEGPTSAEGEKGDQPATNDNVPAKDAATALPAPAPVTPPAPTRTPAKATTAPARANAAVSVPRPKAAVSRASKYPVSSKSKRKKR